MLVDKNYFSQITSELKNYDAALIAVSKTKPAEAINELYRLGQKDFGENKVRELIEKKDEVPGDIRWHFIGHLQTNKVKYISPFIYMIHSVDSIKLVKEIQKRAAEQERKIKILFQVHIAVEKSKSGIALGAFNDFAAAYKALNPLNIEACGLMGMATFTDDRDQIRKEFQSLAKLFFRLRLENVFGGSFGYLSMGMSGDYPLALEAGGNMVRVGSALFGTRN